jgi:uncharacterized protein (TIGR02118 family)
MPVKNIALLKRRADLSWQDFVDYYETRHAPLMLGLLPGVIEYRRNYVEAGDMFIGSGAEAPDFDVVTELVFADQESAEAALAVAAAPGAAERIAADEANFLDRAKTRMFVVHTRGSDLP